MFAKGTLESMQTPETLALPAGAGMDEEHVAESAPMVRAMVVQRLEMMWRACEPHINVPLEDGIPAWKVDPRFIEAGIRVTDRLSRLFRLDHPMPGMSDPVSGLTQDKRELVRAQVVELEARMGQTT